MSFPVHPLASQLEGVNVRGAAGGGGVGVEATKIERSAIRYATHRNSAWLARDLADHGYEA